MNVLAQPKQAELAASHGRRAELVTRYVVRSMDINKAAEAIAIGQSIGNPNVRLDCETNEMWEIFGCEVLEIRPTSDGIAEIDVSYPVGNITPGGITHLLTSIMGGQMDIDLIEECRLIGLTLPAALVDQYRGPNQGIAGIRDFLGAYGRPLIGGIVKPKTGLTPDQLADVCQQMADGGVDFIKEDEILGAIEACPFENRVGKVMRKLEGYKVIFAPCVTSPIANLAGDIAALKKYGCPGFHYNVWGSMDVFKYLSEMHGSFSFYQKSGDKVITTGAFSIDFSVLCQLARLAGADFIHAGMMGGYLDEGEDVMLSRLEILRGPLYGLKNTMPSLSCGATPGMVEHLWERLGADIMVSSGGCLHGHPMGTRAGAKAFRDAAERRNSPELDAAIATWGRS